MYFKNDTLKLLKVLKNYKFTEPKINIFKYEFFNELYYNFLKIIRSINLKDLFIKKVEIKDELEVNSFVSKNIINKSKELIYSYSITFENIRIIYHTKKEIKSIPKKLYECIKIIKTLKILFNRSDFEQTIEIYDINLKKIFPKKENILGPDNVNTAYCNVHPDHNGNITIYRNEELIKVLIHELMHSNLVDKELIFSEISVEMNKRICSNYNILLNEGFTETYACIIHLYYIGYKLNKNKNFINDLYNNEVKYSIYICSKILKHYEIKNIDEILEFKNKCTNTFKQKSNIFSYYFIKLILYLNIGKFSILLKKYTKYNRIHNKKFLKEFLNLVLDNLKDIDKYIIDVNDKNNSLRLTLYELKMNLIKEY